MCFSVWERVRKLKKLYYITSLQINYGWEPSAETWHKQDLCTVFYFKVYFLLNRCFLFYKNEFFPFRYSLLICYKCRCFKRKRRTKNWKGIFKARTMNGRGKAETLEQFCDKARTRTAWDKKCFWSGPCKVRPVVDMGHICAYSGKYKSFTK